MLVPWYLPKPCRRTSGPYLDIAICLSVVKFLKQVALAALLLLRITMAMIVVIQGECVNLPTVSRWRGSRQFWVRAPLGPRL